MGTFLASLPGSILRVFLGAVLGAFYLYIQNGNSFTAIDIDALVGFVTAGLIVATPLVIAALNPQDTRFGKGSS